MRPNVFSILLALGFLAAAVPGATAPLTPTSSTDSTAAQPDSAAAKPLAPVPTAQTPAPTSTPAPAAPVAPAPAAKTPAPAAAAPAAVSTSAKKSRTYYGGTMTLSFGTTSSIGIFPMIGYKLTPKISGGVEAGYQHVTYLHGQSSDNYGGSVFGRFRVGRNLYAHAEYQNMNYEIFSTANTSSREWVPALLLGGGYVKPLSPRTSFYAEALFDVLQDDNSPYKDGRPVVNVGVAVGF